MPGVHRTPWHGAMQSSKTSGSILYSKWKTITKVTEMATVLTVPDPLGNFSNNVTATEFHPPLGYWRFHQVARRLFCLEDNAKQSLHKQNSHQAARGSTEPNPW